ncbi:hypothetical protein XACLE20_440041 [Xanthomonas citri pv. citri]|nr:hypothetical protein XACLE20_440041 [Xanthomonas citri pv. citri]CEH59422.1 hypothetical protein XACLE3_8680013 [Xanthomonas citri pv. citri]
MPDAEGGLGQERADNHHPNPKQSAMDHEAAVRASVSLTAPHPLPCCLGVAKALERPERDQDHEAKQGQQKDRAHHGRPPV